MGGITHSTPSVRGPKSEAFSHVVGKLSGGITELGQLGEPRALCLPPDLPGFQKRELWEEK